MSVLEQIIRDRKDTIPSLKEAAAMNPGPTVKNVIEALKKKEERLSLIAELKRKSPSQGVIKEGATVESVVELYRPYANAMSILTEPNYFGGSLNDLAKASELTDIPLLRKDFITDPLQVKEARFYNADFYLLIVAALSDSQLRELKDAGKEWNMPALIEVHNEAEAERALKAGVEILGINNRNLKDLSIDMSTTTSICSNMDSALDGLCLISESGFSSRQDLLALPSRVDGVLIGTSFMKSPDAGSLLREMFT